jgi:hypothetical protein
VPPRLEGRCDLALELVAPRCRFPADLDALRLSELWPARSCSRVLEGTGRHPCRSSLLTSARKELWPEMGKCVPVSSSEGTLTAEDRTRMGCGG